MKNGKTLALFVHVTTCLALLSLPLFMDPHPGFSAEMFHNHHLKRDLVAYSLTIIFFYLSTGWSIPRFYAARKFLPFVLIAAAFFALIVFFPLALFTHQPPHDMDGPPHGRPPGPPVLFEISHYIFIYLVAFSGSLMLYTREKLKQAEKERLNAELSYLKAQINPHFLFNTLNSIYSLAIQRSDETAEAVVKLSGMMRYVTTEAHKEHVPLGKELDYIGSYIELQRLRLGETADIHYRVEGKPSGLEITPLVLITFVENAFKYGVNPEEDSRIDIRISIAGDTLSLEVKNNKVVVDYSEDSRTGQGVQNAKKRLELGYPGRHKLDIRDKDKAYSVLLKIDLR